MNLPDYLKALGYVQIPLTITRINHLVIQAKINDEAVVLAVDTGASGTCIAESSMKRLRLTSGKAEETATFVLPKKTASSCILERLEIDSLLLSNVKAWLVDFSYVNMALQLKEEQACDGVLGADILIKRSALIDYRGGKLYLKETQAPNSPSGA